MSKSAFPLLSLKEEHIVAFLWITSNIFWYSKIEFKRASRSMIRIMIKSQHCLFTHGWITIFSTLLMAFHLILQTLLGGRIILVSILEIRKQRFLVVKELIWETPVPWVCLYKVLASNHNGAWDKQFRMESWQAHLLCSNKIQGWLTIILRSRVMTVASVLLT